MNRFTLTEEAAGGGEYRGEAIVVLLVTGELDYAACPQFRRRVFGLAAGGAWGIVLDLSLVSFIDSGAIGVLLSAANRLQSSGSGLLVVACAPENTRIMRIFDIVGVARLVTLYGSREQALAALELAAPDLLPGLPGRQSTPLTDSGEHAPGAASGVGAARRYAQEARATAAEPARGADGSAHEVDELA